MENEEKTIRVNPLKLKSLSIILTAVFGCLLVGTFVGKCFINQLEDQNMQSVLDAVFDLFILIFQLLISIFGISTFLQATNYVEVANNQIKQNIEGLFNGNNRDDIILKLLTTNDLIDIVQKSCYRATYNSLPADMLKLTCQFKEFLKQILSKPYIELDERNIQLNILEDGIEKTIIRTQVFINPYGFTEIQFEFEILCLTDTKIDILDLSIDGNSINIAEEIKEFDISNDPRECSYNKKYSFTYKIEPKTRTEVKFTVKYKLPLFDKTGFYINNYVCEHLKHTYDIFSYKPFNVDFVIYSVGKTTLNSDKYNFNHNETTLITSDGRYFYHNTIEFLNFSLPGDGYTYYLGEYDKNS